MALKPAFLLALVAVSLGGCNGGSSSDEASVKPAPKAASAEEAATTDADGAQKDAASPNGMPGGGPENK